MDDKPNDPVRPWDYVDPGEHGVPAYRASCDAYDALTDLAPEMAEAILAFSSDGPAQFGAASRIRLLAEKLRAIGGARDAVGADRYSSNTPSGTDYPQEGNTGAVTHSGESLSRNRNVEHCPACDDDFERCPSMPGCSEVEQGSTTNAAGQPCAPFVIGTPTWPGLAKLAEECGELLQVIGKLIAYPSGDHPDNGPPLASRLQDELADVSAAVEFVVHNAPGMDWQKWIDRHGEKLARFQEWHDA